MCNNIIHATKLADVIQSMVEPPRVAMTTCIKQYPKYPDDGQDKGEQSNQVCAVRRLLQSSLLLHIETANGRCVLATEACTPIMLLRGNIVGKHLIFLV
jgi:hypothetical protein